MPANFVDAQENIRFSSGVYSKNLGGQLRSLSFVPLENPFYTEKLIHYIETRVFNDKFPKAENYRKERLNVYDQKLITLSFFEDEIVYFSSVWRAEHWPHSWYRIANRLYMDRKLRSHCGVLRDISVPHFNHQALFCFDTLRAKTIFISREYPGQSWAAAMAERLNRVNSFSGWTCDQKLYLVCQYPQTKSCWQYLIVNTKEGKIKNPLTSITTEEWKSRFRNG